MRICSGCGTELGSAVLECPACGRLAHGDRLRELAAAAEAADAAGDSVAARDRWREALDLLPASSHQAVAIGDRIGKLTARADAARSTRPRESKTPGTPATRPGWTVVAALAAIGGLAWKFKFVLTFALTKLKFLAMGLSKSSTVFSLVASFGVYWAAWGWTFAAGFLLCMYIHEIGHVFALTRFGIPAQAPMFIPGLGAYVRMDKYPANEIEDARVGLAGPIWGLGATIACLAAFLATTSEYWRAVAHVSATLNLFNLLPLWQLDGGRGFRSLNEVQRILATIVVLLAWGVSGDGLLVLLAIAAGFRSFTPAGRGDWTGLAQYSFLVATLTAAMKF